MSGAAVVTVRERLWLLSHDERFEVLRPLLHPGACQVGLMAATLIDLLLGGHLRLHDGYVLPDGYHIPDQLPPHRDHRVRRAQPDPIAAGVLEAINAHAAAPAPPPDIDPAATTLGAPRLTELLRAAHADLPAGEHHPYVRLYQRTLAALQAAGMVVEHRRTLRSPVYRVPDLACIAAVHRQVSHRLVFHQRHGDLAMDVLCALAWGLNLHHSLLTPYDTKDADRLLRQLTDTIAELHGPASPAAAVPHLARCVRDAVGDLATAAF